MNTPLPRLCLLALAALCLRPALGTEAEALPGAPAQEPTVVTPVAWPEGVAVRQVAFPRNAGVTLAGNLFLPPGFDPAERWPAIVCVHPAGSVKEQSAGLYALLLAGRGFVTLAFDGIYAGASGGEPRRQEMPWERVEDIRWAVDWLVAQPFVDAARIGALGLCAGGGYVLAAAPVERRLRAVAGVSAADIGAANREGWLGTRTRAERIAILEDVAAQRTREARGEPLREIYMCPEPTAETAPSFREGYDYYRTARAAHPRADNRFLYRSQADKMAFSAVVNADLLTQPVLLVVGEKADSHWQTERFMRLIASADKAVVTVPGVSHIDLYDRPQAVGPALEALAAFFARTLADGAAPAPTGTAAARRGLDTAFARTDPELAETFGNFAFDEIVAQTPLIDPRTRARITLAALVATGSPATFRETLVGALEAGMPPEEAKEILYQAVPYLGFGKARECLDVTNDVLRARGVALPLARQGTTTRETRFERGLAIQVETFGEGMREALTTAPEDLRHIRRNLAANCFGDVYTRRGLDMKARELLTFSMLVAHGGCDAQVRGHILGNLAVGNGRATLIQAATALLPYIGYPRTLNALSAIDAVAPADGQK